MDDLDAKLIAERARLVALLSDLADALGTLSIERLAEVLPMIAPLDNIVQRVRQRGVSVSVALSRAEKMKLPTITDAGA